MALSGTFRRSSSRPSTTVTTKPDSNRFRENSLSTEPGALQVRERRAGRGAGLDQLPPGRGREYLRELQMVHRIIPARDKYLLAFERWAADRIDAVEDDGDRKLIRRYLRWRHHRELAARAHDCSPGCAPATSRSAHAPKSRSMPGTRPGRTPPGPATYSPGPSVTGTARRSPCRAASGAARPVAASRQASGCARRAIGPARGERTWPSSRLGPAGHRHPRAARRDARRQRQHDHAPSG